MSVSTTVMPSSSTIDAGVAHARLAARAAATRTPRRRARASVSRSSLARRPRNAPEDSVRLSAMSERSRNLPRRSCLSVPGSSEKMLGKAPGLGADMVFLDLEDAVAPLEKPARPRQGRQRDQRRSTGATRVLCVRVNAWDTEWTYRDVIEVVEGASERLDELMLPKVRDAPPTCIALDHAAHADREGDRPPVARRHRGADRDRARADQRRGDLRGERPARDDHPRPGRHVGVDRDAVTHRWPRHPRVPRRPLPLRVRRRSSWPAAPTVCR